MPRTSRTPIGPLGRAGHRRLLLLTLLVSAGLLLAPSSSEALTSPRTQVDAPRSGSTVIADVTIWGTASHRRGVAEVDLVFKNLDNGTYWNGRGWQPAFVRLPVAVQRPGATNTAWTSTVPWTAMTDGRYRARAFARSVEGNGDATGGDANEFVYRANHELYDTEITGPSGTLAGGQAIVIEGVGRSTVGVAEVKLAVQHRDTDRYWNDASGQWQRPYVQNQLTIDPVGADQVRWRLEIPADQGPVGHYSARAWVRTSTGKGDPYGRGRTTFEVVEIPSPPPPPTTTTPAPSPTTTRPTTTTEPTTTTTVGPTTTRPTTTTTTATTTTTPACPDGDPSILEPCSGVLIGASGDFRADDGSPVSKQDHFAAMEERLGADFDLFHNFLQWRDLVAKSWPSPKTQALADDGHLLLINWKSPTGSVLDWGRIAAGDHDADIAIAAGQIAAFGQPIFIAFYHEPEDNIRDAAGGDQTKIQRYIDDYAAAFRHIHDRFEANGATNAIWVWDMQGWLGGFEDYYERGLYPGDDVVDWVAWNPYNWFGCVNHGNQRKWKPFEQVIEPFYDWLDEGGPNRPSLDKPLMLGEWGSQENDGATNSDQTKAEWLDDARRLLPTRFPRLKALVYFDTEGRRADGTVQFCEWAIDSSPATMDAMTDLLTDPTLQARW